MKEVKCINQIGRKKILSVCYSFLGCLFSLFFAVFLSYANAAAWQPEAFNVNFNILGYNNGAYQWRPNDQELALNDVSVVNSIKAYQWKRNSQNFTGNYATIHFETNIVFPDVNNHVIVRNLDDLYVKFCGSGGSNGTIKSQSITTYKTVWVGSTPYSNNTTANTTITMIGDVVVSGLPSSGSHDLYCGIFTGNGESFAYNTTYPGGNTTYFYFEQQPTSITFTNDETEALMRAQNAILSQVNSSINQSSEDIVNAINNQSQQEQNHYQDQANQNETDISADTSDQEQQATTLLTAITSVFNVIKNTGQSNCTFKIPTNFIESSTDTVIDLCPQAYRTFINKTYPAQNSAWNFSIKSIFSYVIMVVFFVNVAITILMAIKKIYNMFLGGNS